MDLHMIQPAVSWGLVYVVLVARFLRLLYHALNIHAGEFDQAFFTADILASHRRKYCHNDE